MFNNMNNQFDNNTKENTNIEQNNYPNDANIKPIMYKNENNMSLFELNIVFFNIRYPVKISRNGNAIKMLFIITVNENG